MMKKLLLLTLFLSFTFGHAQEKKKVWAKSFIDKKAPELIFQKWISKVPKTEGKFILIDFWATSCGPCKKLIPELNSYHKSFKKDMVVIGISAESEEKLKAFESKIDYYQTQDIRGKNRKKYGVKGIPHAVIIDPEGIVRWEGYPLLNGHILTEKVIRKIIKKYK